MSGYAKGALKDLNKVQSRKYGEVDRLKIFYGCKTLFNSMAFSK
jgi:hypothetical protein